MREKISDYEKMKEEKNIWDEFDKHYADEPEKKPPQTPGAGGYGDVRFDETAKQSKFGFQGFQDLWKKTQESMSGEGAIDFAKRTTHVSEKHLPLINDHLKGIKEKMGEHKGGLR